MTLAISSRAACRATPLPCTAKKPASTHAINLASSSHRSKPWNWRRAPVQCHSVSESDSAVQGSFWGGEDFYTIMGVDPFASPKDIKRAYYQCMREFHPDRSGEYDSTDLCALINEIYNILMDEEKRATYDALAGFSLESVNPFKDNSFPSDQVFVDEVSCIGCGKCVRQCPSTFFIEASRYGRARVIQQGAEEEEDVQIAMETCPVDCIHWVTAPQLSLLEVALGKMERVDVYVMMRNFRQPGDVFKEASRAWQRRQSDLQARLESSSRSTTTGWTFWGQQVEFMKDDNGGGGRQTAGQEGRVGRRIADLAASAARAARLWKQYQSEKEPAALLQA